MYVCKLYTVFFLYSILVTTNTPAIGTFSVHNYISQLSRNYTGSTEPAESDEYVPMFNIYDTQKLKNVSDPQSYRSETSTSRLYRTDLYCFPFKGLDAISLDLLDNSLKNPPGFLDTQYKECALIPPSTRLDFKLRINRSVPAWNLLFPSKLSYPTLSKPELLRTSLPADFFDFNYDDTTYTILSSSLHIDKVMIRYELLEFFESIPPCIKNVFSGYKLVQTALTSSSSQCIDIYVPDECTNFLYLSFSTENEINFQENSHQYINTVKRLPPNLKSLKLLWNTFEPDSLYDQVYLNNLHLDTLDITHLNYYSYLVKSGFCSSAIADKCLKPYSAQNRKLNPSASLSDSLNGKFFYTFPVSLQALKMFHKSNKYGVSGSVARPCFKLQLNFTSVDTSISKFYLHVLYVNSHKATFKSDVFDQEVEFERYPLIM